MWDSRWTFSLNRQRKEKINETLRFNRCVADCRFKPGTGICQAQRGCSETMEPASPGVLVSWLTTHELYRNRRISARRNDHPVIPDSRRRRGHATDHDDLT